MFAKKSFTGILKTRGWLSSRCSAQLVLRNSSQAMAADDEFASAQQLLEYMDEHKLRAKEIFEMMDVDKSEGVTVNEIGQLLHNIGATEQVGEFNEDTVNEVSREGLADAHHTHPTSCP